MMNAKKSELRRLNPVHAGLFAGVVIFIAAGLLMIDVSHRLADRKAGSELDVIAQRVLARSESVVGEAIDALRTLQDVSSLAPCGRDAMSSFSRALSGTHRLRAIGGIMADGRGCLNLGGGEISTSLPAPTWTDSKYAVWLDVGGKFGLPEHAAAVSFGQVFAVVDPFFFVEAVAAEHIHIALLDSASGRPIAATPGADLPGMAAARSSASTIEGGGQLYVAQRHASAPVIVVVSQQSISYLQHWRSEGWVWFSLAMVFGVLGGIAAAAAMRRHLSPESEFRRALANREFLVFYQPIVDLHTARCEGAEALVRWRRPDGTMVRPDLFIPLAEETGLVLPLTDQVLENVVADLGALLRNRPLYVSVNLSARDVVATRVLDLAERLLSKAEIAPGRIAFEATERGFAEAQSAREALRRYRGAGHRILIDDFGTGYSSLSQLQSFEVDAIKIDKSFIDAIGTGGATRSVVPHIIAMAKELGLKLVAEGVETDSQLRYLREQGVEHGQGWLFGKPMPAGDFLRYVEKQATA